MKKLIVITVLMLLCGCSNIAEVSPAEVAKAYKNSFNTAAKAEFYENEAEMEISKKPMSISVVLNFPADISGMETEIFDEHATVRYEGMEQNIKKDSLPDGTPFLLLEELFDDLSDPEDFVLSTEGNALFAKGDDFSATLSSEDFSVLKAEFPKYRTVFTFTDFVFAPSE